MIKATAYSSLQPVYAESDEQLAALQKELLVDTNPNLVVLVKHPVFPERADYFPSGFFRNTGDRPIVQELGSALDLRDFKTLLAQKFAGRPLSAIVAEPEPCPFFEILYFNENGQHYMIGPKTSDKLARDFDEHHNQAEGVGGVFYKRYSALYKSFNHAKRSGAVSFSGP